MYISFLRLVRRIAIGGFGENRPVGWSGLLGLYNQVHGFPSASNLIYVWSITSRIALASAVTSTASPCRARARSITRSICSMVSCRASGKDCTKLRMRELLNRNSFSSRLFDSGDAVSFGRAIPCDANQRGLSDLSNHRVQPGGEYSASIRNTTSSKSVFGTTIRLLWISSNTSLPLSFTTR